MNLKLHLMHSQLVEFPENREHYSEEQGERFYQDIKLMETRYQGRWDLNMMADFCWTLITSGQSTQHKGICCTGSLKRKELDAGRLRTTKIHKKKISIKPDRTTSPWCRYIT